MKEETVRLPFCEVRALWVLPQRGIREMRENGHPGTFCSGDFCGVFTRKKNFPFRILHAADAAEREEKMKLNQLKGMREFIREEDGMGTVEIILIIVVLVGLVIIFKGQIIQIINSLFQKITSQTGTV